MELLAPAGSRQALTAAVQSGADAVYLGGPQFGARYSAENFTIEEMKTWVDYCHLYGVDVHVTVNTLVKEKEIESLKEYLKQGPDYMHEEDNLETGAGENQESQETQENRVQ